MSGLPESPPGLDDHKGNPGYPALQRRALQAILELSPEAVQAGLKPIERQHRKTLEGIEKRFQRVDRRIGEHIGRRLGEIREHYDRRVAEVARLHASDLQGLVSRSQSVRDRIEQETTSAQKEAKRHFDHEVWLADSVGEAAHNQAERSLKELDAAIPRKRQSLDELDNHGRWLMGEYRVDPPTVSAESGQSDPADADARAAYREQKHLAEAQLETLSGLSLPKALSGAQAWGFVLMFCVVAVGVSVVLALLQKIEFTDLIWAGPVAAMAGLVLAILLGRMLKPVAERQVQHAYIPLARALSSARSALDLYHRQEARRIRKREADAIKQRESEIEQAQQKHDSRQAEIREKHDHKLKEAAEAHEWLKREIESRRETGLQDAEAYRQEREPMLQARLERFKSIARRWHEDQRRIGDERFQEALHRLESEWRRHLADVRSACQGADRLRPRLFGEFDDPAWSNWRPSDHPPGVVRFGQLQIAPGRIASEISRVEDEGIVTGAARQLPAVLSLPDRGSLLIQFGRDGRSAAIRAIQSTLLRLLTTFPPGRVRFTIVDPVGLGENFAGFMHLADYDEALVCGRIWTEATHIEQRLTDLTEHMENVIQKYLRNEFKTIDSYNAQAGELAEPYRFLVVADFPANFNEEAIRRLGAIVASGPRCGVFTLIAQDTRRDLPPGLEIDDLESGSIVIRRTDDGFTLDDDVCAHYPLVLDTPPSEEETTRLMHVIGEAARQSKRVEVPFSAIAPKPEQIGSADSSKDIRVPIGRTGATRLQYLQLGQGVAQHALIAGKTGSGKSTLLHVLITNLVSWYPPEEVEFYLIDFKKGVEFKTYATHVLPHARAVAIESDREFGLSVLQRIDAEMETRGQLFREQGVQDIAAYRRVTGTRIPRTLLIVDEFQIFFSEDDKLAQDAAVLLDRLVRQGRAFGIHVLLGSQTLGGAGGLARSTIGQMAVRIALQCSEADAQLILDDDNTAARLLARPGEAIYNDAGGLVQGNSPFQTAWLDDRERDAILEQVVQRTRDQAPPDKALIVFEGNAPSDLAGNRMLERLLHAPHWPVSSAPPQVWLGEAVAIKEPTSATFRRQSGANLLMVGQRDDAALAMMGASLLALAAQHEPSCASFVIMDGSPADAPTAGQLQRVAAAVPHATHIVEWREVDEALNGLTRELQERRDRDRTDAPAVYVLVYGLQRYRMLRRQEDDFSFSMDEDKPPAPDRQFADLVREGPPFGIHVITWVDAPTSLERCFDRSTLREFDNRVLFQMSAADSSNLIDSPVANQLGLYRALFSSEEKGILEKFRPYAPPSRDRLDKVAEALQAKTASPSPPGLQPGGAGHEPT